MSDMITICPNLELSEVKLICHQFEENLNIWKVGFEAPSLVLEGAELQ